MKRVALTVLTCVAALLAAPAAHASGNYDTIWGGCAFATDATASGGDTYVGVLSDFSVSTTGLVPVPIDATVTCSIQVNGVDAPGTVHTYGDGTTAVQAGADPVSYTAGASDIVWLCEIDHFADGTTLTDRCGPTFGDQFPPQRVIDLVNFVFVSAVDPAACPALVKLAGNYPGGLTIAADGDVSVPDPLDLGLNPVYDCPPYAQVGG